MPNDAEITFSAAQLPEGACYSTEQERLGAFAQYLTGTLPGEYSTVNVGSSAPAANDRDKPWLRTNTDGSPDGVYHWYDGSWKRKHPEAVGTIKLWLGTADAVTTLDGGVAGTATTASGPFWEVVSAFAARFPVGVGTFEASGAVAVSGTGGTDKHTLTTAEMPEHTHGPLEDDGETATGICTRLTAGDGRAGSLDSGTNFKQQTTTAAAGGGQAHTNLPPYVGAYFIRRTVRQFFSI
jgi:hypothetical protein